MNGLASASAALLSVLLLGGSPLSWGSQEEDGPLRYARVASERARILNLADEKGVVVGEPEKGSTVAVYEDSTAGWVGVEVPGGFPLWVYGRYLAPTDEEGVYEVTRNAVNIRPGPSSDVTSFPLPHRLHAGDRVRVIEVHEESKPLAETWARIWTPPGVWAWIHADAIAPLADGEDGEALWSEGLARAASARGAQIVARVKESSAPASPAEPTRAEKARAALDEAQTLLKEESQSTSPDLPAVRTAVEAVLDTSPTGPVALEARQTLERVAALEEAARLRVELEAERERRTLRAIEEQRRVWEASKKKDPLGGVFLHRGVLVRRHDAEEELTRYFLKWGGELACELHCATGRYDFEMFTGYEVGIQGAAMLTADPSAIPPVEVSRLEVIASR